MRLFSKLNSTLNKLEAIINTEKAQNQLNSGLSHFFTLVRNNFRCGALENIYRAYQSCSNKSIIVLLDGDDWLARSDVLSELNKVYSTEDIWYTHGTMKEYIYHSLSDSTWRSIPLSPDVIANHSFRSNYCPSHLRTIYTWLLKKIVLEDLLFNGEFFPATGDKAIMFPVAEMGGNRHSFISNPSYIYNVTTQINDHKVKADFQIYLDHYIRELPCYPLLKYAPRFLYEEN